MQTNYIENLSSRIQNRAENLNKQNFQTFYRQFQFFWKFLKEQPIIFGIFSEIERTYQQIGENIKFYIIKTSENLDLYLTQLMGTGSSFERSYGIKITNEEEFFAECYFILKNSVDANIPEIEIAIGTQFLPKRISLKLGITGQESAPNFIDIRNKDEQEIINLKNKALEHYCSVFLTPFLMYLQERLDRTRLTLYLLYRYKHKCEWFQREELFQKWEGNTSKGEKLLAKHLYEFLFDNGLEFEVEPESVSGRIDLIGVKDRGGRPMVDAKVFQSRNQLAKKGFHQIYRYLLERNETTGFLVVYITSDSDIKFSLTDQEQGVPFIEHNHKIIFVITIDIFSHPEPASKSKGIKSIEVSTDYIVEILNQEQKENSDM